MNRICHKDSFNAVYMQHGVMDNSFTWIIHESSDSIAYQVYEQGYDVFMGNFRGIFPRRMVEGKDFKDYWKYTIDDLAIGDIAAFIDTIYKTKVKELKAIHYKGSEMSEEDIDKEIESKLKITYIGHSLGGMVLPIYIIHQKRQNKPHHLTAAILLSPAGIH